MHYFIYTYTWWLQCIGTLYAYLYNIIIRRLCYSWNNQSCVRNKWYSAFGFDLNIFFFFCFSSKRYLDVTNTLKIQDPRQYSWPDSRLRTVSNVSITRGTRLTENRFARNPENRHLLRIFSVSKKIIIFFFCFVVVVKYTIHQRDVTVTSYIFYEFLCSGVYWLHTITRT